ncbi:hypothetical protein NLO72_21920 [Pseudomonas tremae]|uniref:hypothetical protein n=2 Tax=Pseudomonas syringae group TaxID=136849 RepID=UPI00210ECCDE|nr:hypothetical protein [Pseudomonas tremae]MCQ2991866.1 hypothetical protein [Pseudomonas tremae]
MMDYLEWLESVIEKLVKAGFELDLVDKALKDAEAEIKIEYTKGELNSAGTCFIKYFEKYDVELALSRERGEGRSTKELAEAYKLSEMEAGKGLVRGTKKKLAILSGFRGGEVDFAEKKRKVLYYLPSVHVTKILKFSNFSIQPFLSESDYGSLLVDNIFDGKGSIIEVDGFKSGDHLDEEVDPKIFDALEKLKFGYFFLNPSHSGSIDGYVSSESFECFRVIEKNPDGAFEQKVELTNGMFSFSASLQAYYQHRVSHQQKPVYLTASKLRYVNFLTDGLNSPDHMAAIRMYNRCWGTYSIHSHHDKALLAKVSTEILLDIKKIEDKRAITKLFCESIKGTIAKFSKSNRLVNHIDGQFRTQELDLEKAIDFNLVGLKKARDKISHDGIPDYSHINIPFYLVWFPIFWLAIFCNDKITEDEGIRFSLFCGLMCFSVADWQAFDYRAFPQKKSHIQKYADDSRLFPEYMRKASPESLIDNCLESVTRWLSARNQIKQ